MKEEDLELIQTSVEHEGFDYCFVWKSSFPEIKDEKFHKLREAYVKAQKELAEYCEIEDN